MRNGNILLNVGPDRHGKIPETHAALLRHFGAWLAVVGDSIYGTRGGPWNPVDDQYGFTFKPGKYFIHILPGYSGAEITTPSIPQKVTGCCDLFTRKPLAWTQNADGTVHITGLDPTSHNADTVVSVVTQGSMPANPPR
jgi:alpha-L-fucosidase